MSSWVTEGVGNYDGFLSALKQMLTDNLFRIGIPD